MKNEHRRRFRFDWLVFMMLGLVAIAAMGCSSSDSDSSSAVLKGKFLDSTVEGIEYSTDSQSGVTDPDGTFNYEEGETVTFSIGGITVGQVQGQSIITPVDLSQGVENNSKAVNISRFLLTLDDDDNPDNGIAITEDVRKAAENLTINFDSGIGDFESDHAVIQAIASLTALTASGQRTLVSAETAQTHLRNTLAGIDNDEDGYTENEGDCDDSSADVHPGADDICGDGIDQDCSGSDLFCAGSLDADDDGDTYSETAGDCDDTNAAIYPGAEDILRRRHRSEL